MQFINPHKNYDQIIISKYKNKLLLENIIRLKYVAWAGSSVNAIIIFINIMVEGLNGMLAADSILRFLWIIASFAYVFLVGSPKKHEHLHKRHRIIFFAAAMLSLLFSGVIMCIGFYDTGYTFLYIINCMITSSFFYFSFFEILFVMMPTICFYMVFIISVGFNIPNFVGNTINIFTVSIFGILISAMTYRSQIALLDSQQIIFEHNNSLKELAEIDGLTQIPNRRKFEQVYSLEWAHACRERNPLSIIMIDIDYFKNYNDYYGHLAGDDCLKQIALILKSSLLRQTDFVCRYGGEEFIVILANTDQANAKNIAQRIQHNILKACIPHDGSDFKQITLSLGIATLRDFCCNTKEELISVADKAMYSIK